jgi:predicted ATPase
MDDRFGLLANGGPVAPARQRTLRATIDWSHDLLAEGEQSLLRRLSVFAGWSLEMAEQLCSGGDLPAADVLGLLASLADKSLVVADTEAHAQTRYRMLDTIRDYAASRLATAGETAMMRRRLRDYSLDEVERTHRMGMALIPAPWSVTVETFRRFDVEAGNLRQVLSHSLAEPDAETGLRICAAARPIWIVRGRSLRAPSGSTRSSAWTPRGFRLPCGALRWWAGLSWRWLAIRPAPERSPRKGSRSAGRQARRSGSRPPSTCWPRCRCTRAGPRKPRP